MKVIKGVRKMVREEIRRLKCGDAIAEGVWVEFDDAREIEYDGAGGIGGLVKIPVSIEDERAWSMEKKMGCLGEGKGWLVYILRGNGGNGVKLVLEGYEWEGEVSFTDGHGERWMERVGLAWKRVRRAE